MLTWRTELEQNEVRAEAALVTILSLTQVTELKLLLDCGPDSHRFYALVLSLLVTAIALEVLVGAVVIYVGGIHRTKPPKSASTPVGCDDDDDVTVLTSRRHRYVTSQWRHDGRCCCWCLWRRHSNRRATLKDYKTQETLATSSGATQELLQTSSGHKLGRSDTADTDDQQVFTCCPRWYQSPAAAAATTAVAMTTMTSSSSTAPPAAAAGSVAINMTRLSANYTVQQSSAIRLADLEYQLTRVRTRVDSLEGAAKRGTATSGELDAARRELEAVSRMRDDAETNRKLAEMRHRREEFMCELETTRRQAAIFLRVASWQNVVTYLVYVIMLLNVVITTFGMSGDKGGPIMLYRHHSRS